MTSSVTENLDFALRRSISMVKSDPEAAKAAFHAVAERGAPLCPSCGKAVKHRLGVEWCQAHEMSERTLQDRVRDRAKRRGWRVVHIGKGIAAFDAEGNPIFITPADPGWPDLTLAKAGHRLIFMELKREAGVVSPEQCEWISLLNQCGARAIVVRPSDLIAGRVNAILKEGSPLE